MSSITFLGAKINDFLVQKMVTILKVAKKAANTRPFFESKLSFEWDNQIQFCSSDVNEKKQLNVDGKHKIVFNS